MSSYFSFETIPGYIIIKNKDTVLLFVGRVFIYM